MARLEALSLIHPTMPQLSEKEREIIQTKEPLYGLLSRKVDGERVRLALVSESGFWANGD